MLDSIAVALCAVRCGADGWVAVATFGRAKAAWLRTCLALPGGLPSHDTFGRVFARLDPAEFRRGFLSWVGAVVPDTVGHRPGGTRALDGKTLRRSHDRANGKAALHMVSAWASGSGLVLGQLAVDDQSNESTAIPALLALLDVRGCTVTIDALGCQTAIAAAIVAQGADDALALKDNHPTLHAEAAEEFAAFAPADHAAWQTVEQGHGRLERRRSWTIREPETIAHLDRAAAWAGLRAIGLVERERRVGAALTVATRYDLLSGTGDAAAFGHAIRSHWGVEHRVHWVRDVAFREDESRVRAGDGAENLAVLRHFALNLLRQERTAKGSIATKRFRAARDHDYLLTILAGLHR